jgi:uncharacterized membrane protein YbaN (DUF454 family)
VKTIFKFTLIIIGTFSVGLGFLGVFLPLLPTTPFLLLAAACYGRSSQRFNNWLLSNRLFGEYIRNWKEGKGIPLKTKFLSVLLIVLSISHSVLFVVPLLVIKVFLVLIGAGISLYIISRPTLADSAKPAKTFK